MDVVTAGVVPSEFAVLLWAPLLALALGYLLWLVVLVAVQKHQRAKAARAELRGAWIGRALARSAARSQAAFGARPVPF